MNRNKLIQDLIKYLFWGKTLDFNTESFETPENIEIVNRAIDVSRQQLPLSALNDEHSIYQRCIILFRRGAYHFYKNWC